MGKTVNQKHCIYCGVKSGKNDECSNCREKKKLIRKMRAMLMPYYRKKVKANEQKKQSANIS